MTATIDITKATWFCRNCTQPCKGIGEGGEPKPLHCKCGHREWAWGSTDPQQSSLWYSVNEEE